MLKKFKFKRLSIICTLSILAVLTSVLIGKTYSDELTNDVRVEEESELKYYLKVKYDGVDKEGIESSDTVTAKIRSDVIHVEDKIPDGLTFLNFETTEDGTIGAVQRGDNSKACPGKVIDNTKTDGVWNTDKTEYTYHGLHYNKTTNIVSFDVENLQAGCVLNVGIVTQTPKLGANEKRKDFYNFASIVEDELSDISNTVHTYIGKDENLHKVTYKYDDTAPDNVPNPPVEMNYSEGATVGVAGGINVEGYEFLGWKPENNSLEIIDGQFTMPDGDVVLVGKFKKIDIVKYIVNYEIDGDIPEGYVLPRDKEYAEGKLVTLDSFKPGDVFNGYKFLGWKSKDSSLEIIDGQFLMPSKNVTIVGKFEEIKYTVRYEFYDTVLPTNHQNYLPASETYKPGEKVKVKDVTGEPDGYKFLGWYKEDNFVMPEKDVVIYGEWKVQSGTFAPTITKEIIDKKESYKAGDKVEFKITVTNTAEFDIINVMISENNDGAKFIDGEGYEVSSEHIVTIPTIKAGEIITLYAEYIVTEEDEGTIINEVEILGALADNNYELEDKEYKATTQFEVKKQSENKQPEVKPGVENPTTLDNIIKYIIIAIVSLVAIISIIVLVKKINKNK